MLPAGKSKTMIHFFKATLSTLQERNREYVFEHLNNAVNNSVTLHAAGRMRWGTESSLEVH